MLRFATIVALVAVFIPGIATAQASDVRQFAEELQDSLNSCTAELITERLDAEALIRKALDGLDAPPKFIKDAAEGLRTSLNNWCESGTTFQLLGVRPDDEGETFILRLLSELGVNYHSYHLSRGEDGTLTIIDIYVGVTGQLLSQTMRDSLLPILIQQDQSVVKKLLSTEGQYVRSLPRLIEALELSTTNPAASIKIYDDLPESLRDSRTGLLVAVTASSQLDQAKYRRALERVKRLSGEDPSLSLMLIDHYFMQEAWSNAHAAVDSTDDRFGPDPYLDAMRASIELSRVDLEKAAKFVDAAVTAEPTLEEAWWIGVNVSLAAQDHRETVRLLDELTLRFSYIYEDLESLPEYANFVKSKAYKKWRKRK